MAMYSFYDVLLVRPGKPAQRIATVRGRRTATAMSNWFPGIADFHSPDIRDVRSALPHYLRLAWDRDPTVWHTEGTLHASTSLRGSRGKVLATIRFEGYEREI